RASERFGHLCIGHWIIDSSFVIRHSNLAAMLVLLLLGIMAKPIIAADAVTGEILSVGIGGNVKEGEQSKIGGMYRAGSWVPVRVRLKNRSGKTFSGRLGVEQPDLDGD